MHRKIIKHLAVIVGISGLSVTAAYATFTSNSVAVYGNTIRTGEAALKVCDGTAANRWTTNITTNLNLDGIIPDEERDLLGNQVVYVGNDNGGLQGVLPGNCTSYLDAASQSRTPLRLTPNVVFASETCPDPLPSNLKLRFEVKGTSSDYKTLNAWSSNTTGIDPALTPGEASRVKVYTQLSSTSTAQNASCTFGMTFTGKQPTS